MTGAASGPRFSPEVVLRALGDHQVDYVLVGGLAMTFYGSPRVTMDMDIVPGRSAVNDMALRRVLEAIDARAEDADGIDRTQESIALGEPVRVETLGGVVDVLQGLPGIPPYAELSRRAVTIEAFGTTVSVAHRDHLIAMKRAAGRPHDFDDIAFLASRDSRDS